MSSQPNLCKNCDAIFTTPDLLDGKDIVLDIEDLKPRSCLLCSTLWHRQNTETALLKRDGFDARVYEVRIKAQGLTKLLDGRMNLDVSFRVEGLKHGDHTIRHNVLICLIEEDCIPPHVILDSNHATNTISKSSVAFVQACLVDCLNNHKTCRTQQASKSKWIPDRLLEIGEEIETLVTLRSKENLPQGTPYFSLSHCWGTMQPMKLTSQSYEALRTGVSVLDMPKTFQDAILICKISNISHIWIDSLCIFQDDWDDWNIQAAQMQDVYTHARCCIAATSAGDGSIGLSFDRDLNAYLPFWVYPDWPARATDLSDQLPKLKSKYLLVIDPAWRDDIKLGPLNSRSWVLQERYLSPRILHFTSRQIVWECLEMVCPELESQSNKFFPNMSSTQREAKLKAVLALKKVNPSGTTSTEQKRIIQRTWNSIVEDYSGRGLTKGEDKLIALNGIAQHIAQATGDRFIAGLWLSTILEDVLWHRYGSFFEEDHADIYPGRWRAPTWSWASLKCRVSYWQYHGHYSCDKSCYPAVVREVDVKSSTTGQLDHANLVIRARLCPVWVLSANLAHSDQVTLDCVPDTTDATYQTINTKRFTNIFPNTTLGLQNRHINTTPHSTKQPGSQTHQFTIHYDTPTTLPDHSFLVLLPTVECSGPILRRNTDYAICLRGLVLRKCGLLGNTYRRVGMFVFQESEDIEIFREWEQRDECDIVLI